MHIQTLSEPVKELVISWCLSAHSFIQAISIAPLQVQFHLEVLPTTARILRRSFVPKRFRQLQVKDLPKVFFVAARARFEPATLWTKGTESTNEPPCCMRTSRAERV